MRAGDLVAHPDEAKTVEWALVTDDLISFSRAVGIRIAFDRADFRAQILENDADMAFAIGVKEEEKVASRWGRNQVVASFRPPRPGTHGGRRRGERGNPALFQQIGDKGGAPRFARLRASRFEILVDPGAAIGTHRFLGDFEDIAMIGGKLYEPFAKRPSGPFGLQNWICHR